MQNRINTVGDVVIWDITIDKEKIFRAVSLHTNYAYDKAQKQPGTPTNNQQIVMDDDRTIFDEYFNMALARLKTIILKRCDRNNSSFTTDATTGVITARLFVGQNHPTDAKGILQSYCRQFLIDKCIELWNNSSDEKSKADEAEINHTLYLRKSPVSEFRKCNPLF